MKARTTRTIVSGKSSLEKIPALLSRLWPGKKALIIADENTWAAAGASVARIIAAAGISAYGKFVYPGSPRLHTDTVRIAELTHALAGVPGAIPIAVGSGTLNDIVKRAAEEAGLTYLCVPTAPSVDGYTSFGAAVIVNGFKTTLPCSAPVAVVADEDVMASAPYELLAAGYGDLAAKLSSGRDWLIARELGLETIDPAIWDLSQGKLVSRLSVPDRLASREPGAVRGVFDGLCDTGLAMQDQGDSRPASGAEHHISHCWEMRGLSVNGVEVLHGQKVAAGTLLSTALCEILFSYSKDEVRQFVGQARETTADEREREIRALYSDSRIPESAIADILQASLAKLVVGAKRAERLALIVDQWDEMRAFAFDGRPTYGELSRMFRAARCPSFGEIGVDRELATWGVLAAQTIRNRYTAFDLAYELGVFQKVARLAVERVFQAE